jgi:hypothetical protein
LILGFARDLVFFHQILGMPARVFPGESVVQAVAKQAVVELSVSEAITPAATLNEVGRLIHALHAARDGRIGVTQKDLLRRRHNRLRPRTANTVHRHRGDGHWQAGLHRRLTGRIHLRSGLNDIAHRHGLDLVGPEPGSLDRGADRDGAQIRRRHVLQGPAERADCRADGLCNHH